MMFKHTLLSAVFKSLWERPTYKFTKRLGYFLSGFCHFGLVSFMGFVTESWHSRHVRFSCERVASSVLELGLCN